MLERDIAIVLRTTKLGEADRIISLITRHHGRVRAVGKGVRKSSSRFGARLEPFNVIDIQWHTGKNLATVNQVEIMTANAAKIAVNYDAYASATAVVEITEKLTDDELGGSGELFDLLRGALGALATGTYRNALVMDAFMIRGLSQAGWAPSLEACAVCGSPPPFTHFSVPAGGVICSNCTTSAMSRLQFGVAEHLTALLHGDWAQAHNASGTLERSASRVLAGYMEWHVERRLKSLRHVERDT